MSAGFEVDPLVAHYAETIVMIESLVLRRVPRLPFMPSPGTLTAHEVMQIAERLAGAHDLAQDVAP